MVGVHRPRPVRIIVGIVIRAWVAKAVAIPAPPTVEERQERAHNFLKWALLLACNEENDNANHNRCQDRNTKEHNDDDDDRSGIGCCEG